jgi:hypothetical protein
VAETISIVRVPCRFGRTRPYFICPGVVNGIACGRRVAKLHGPGRYFLCRYCYRLAHTSQSEAAWDRARCGERTKSGSASEASRVWPRRSREGMWRQTYERLRNQAFEAEMLADRVGKVRTLSQYRPAMPNTGQTPI